MSYRVRTRAPPANVEMSGQPPYRFPLSPKNSILRVLLAIGCHFSRLMIRFMRTAL